MFFLYLGAFPPYSDIEVHIIFKRLSAEGFLEPVGEQNLEDFMDGEQAFEDYMVKCTAYLAFWYNLVLLDLNTESWFSMHEFRVHSCWQHLCKKEATRIKFLHVLQSYGDVVNDQRRLCAHYNTLFAFKQVYDSIKSDCASTVRSLLCFGPFHQYPVPIHAMDFKLLKVLEAVKVRFYHFPLEILKLVCLKYIALTCAKELPVSISDLFNLQFLIIFPYINIKKRGALLYMPVEIWDMQELQHIEVRGKDLPPPDSAAALDRLSSLFGVSEKSCTREILKRIPNLKKLGIVVDLQPYEEDDHRNRLSDLGYISKELQSLKILSYAVMNPDMKCELKISLSMFPSSLTSLCLSGLGCPWKYMNDIGLLLPNLMFLTLQGYAFRSPEWNIKLGSFLKLETIVIEDTDMLRLRPQQGSLPRLRLLSIRHCYKLQQLDWTRDPSMVTTTIELIECNPLAVASAKQL